MTNEEALYWHTHNGATIEQERESESLIKEALEKRIQKKPEIKVCPDEDEKFVWEFYICPVCKCHIGMKYNRFCPNCGQKLDWGDAE